MKFINHITLNTGHIRKSYVREVDKKLYFVLKRIHQESLEPDGSKLFDKYTLKSTVAASATIATIFDSEGIPVLTTLCTKSKEHNFWEDLHDTSSAPLATQRSQPISTPYIADRLEVGAMFNLDALKWTGDFSRCFGWLCLYPRDIR